jgi:PAS domain-containing protein
LGKSKDEDRLDCGGCGYYSCIDFAVAYLRGMGDKQMCVTTMRKRAQKKMDMLLRTLPMGVVIVNRQMNIAECNSEFVKLFSEIDFEPDEEFVHNFVNLPINKFIDITGFLEQILVGNKSLFQERIKYNDQFLRASFFSIERMNLAGVIFQDITTTSMKREVVIKKAEEVINKNLQSVQQIASLLGENAAETEIILRSLTDQFQYSTPEVD